MSLSELRTKDVICTQDGKRLGKVMDLEFDPHSGCITALVVPGEFKVTHVLRGEKCGLVIPWNRIRKIGENVILVQLDECDFMS